MPNDTRKDWRQIAQQAASEKDPKKLLGIIEELNRALDERERRLRAQVSRRAEAKDIRRRLLFVDDEPNIRLTLPPLLQQHGFDVKVGADVPEAISLIKRSKFDVLVSDINISEEGDGFTVVRAIREANPDCVTILLTGYPAFESAVHGIREDVDDYFVKPAELDVLIGTIEQKLLERSSGDA
jgi:DNA-binding NtrC family response regulator